MRPDRFISLLLAEVLPRRFRNGTPRVSVLMYHAISEDAEKDIGDYYRVVTSPLRFRAHMDWLAEHGYRTVTLGDAVTELAEGRIVPRTVVVTFDDGFRDVIERAWPVMAELGQTATVFIATGCVDAGTGFKGRSCLTWEEIKMLDGAGMEMGSHTALHPHLYGMSWTDIEKELVDSKRALESRLGHDVVSFAYPFAYPEQDKAWCARFSALLARAGYRCCATTRIGRVRAQADLMSLKRLPMNDADDLDFFRAKLEGAYDWLYGLQRVSKLTRARRRCRVVAV